MTRLDDKAVPALIARGVHGAQWCEFHIESGRLFVWHGLPHVCVIDLATGVESERWPIHVAAEDRRPRREAVAGAVLERLRAGY